MNKQRKVVITTTYNEMGIIIDTKAEEVAQLDLQPTCNQLATDCISRQMAIEAFEPTHYTDWYTPTIIETLEALPFVKPEPHWIPCSERLPEANGRYLVTRGLNACGALWNRVYIINYTDLMGLKSGRIWWDGNVGKSDFEQIADVIAWMPLPKGYKGGESE